MSKKKEIKFMMIWLILLSGVILTQEKEGNKEMTNKWYVWRYTESIQRVTSDGAVGFYFYTDNQALARIIQLSVNLEGGSSEDAGGTSQTTAYIELDGGAVTDNIVLINAEITNEITLPCDNYVGTFFCPPLDKVILTKGDEFYCYRSHIDTGSTVYFDLKVLLNTYEVPTVGYYASGFNARSTLYHNEIIGTVEEW